MSARDDVELLAPREVAEILRIPSQTVTRYGNNGRLLTTRTLGRHHRFFGVEVRALADGGGPGGGEGARRGGEGEAVRRAAVKVPAHLQDYARIALAEGWTITKSGSGHLCWRPPKGPPVFTGSTPKRRGHGPENARRRLARAGLGARRG